MKAITLHRPWPYCITMPENWKNIENRRWRMPTQYEDQDVAIHAGQVWDEDAARFLCGNRINGTSYRFSADRCPSGVIVAVVKFERSVTHSSSPWFCGPYGWPIYDRRVLPEPVSCRGAQGLWTVPVDIEAQIRAKLEAI